MNKSAKKREAKKIKLLHSSQQMDNILAMPIVVKDDNSNNNNNNNNSSSSSSNNNYYNNINNNNSSILDIHARVIESTQETGVFTHILVDAQCSHDGSYRRLGKIGITIIKSNRIH